jgi:hypothetical protein
MRVVLSNLLRNYEFEDIPGQPTESGIYVNVSLFEVLLGWIGLTTMFFTDHVEEQQVRCHGQKAGDQELDCLAMERIVVFVFNLRHNRILLRICLLKRLVTTRRSSIL